MAERTEYAPGLFSWVDLSTSDPDAAKAFYVDLFGWKPVDHKIPGGGVYTMLELEGSEVAALSAAREGQPTAWNSYVTVASADDSAGTAEQQGGRLLAGPFDVGDAGRMATVADPNGAVLNLWEPRRNPGAGRINEPGALTMNQLNTTDPERSQRFYEGLFGWRFEPITEADQPYWGVYNGGRLNAGMLGEPPDAWLVYFGCKSVDDDAVRIPELGGQVVVEPLSIPAGRFLVAQDPQGGMFALFSGEYDD